jgi:aminoglycoside phosphotransferase (APT) family kinase protein
MNSTVADLRKLGEGREAEIFAWEEGSVLRLLRPALASQSVEREAAAMNAAASCGADVPRVIEVVSVDGRPGLVMERVQGPDLLTLLGRRPWKILWVARITAGEHARLNAAPAPAELPSLRQAVRARIASSELVPARLVPAALAVVDRLPEGDRLCHGDFHPGNLIAAGRRAVTIDWTHATRGDPAADFARTLVVLRASPLPPGASRLLAVLTRFLRGVLVRLYDRSYRRRAGAGLARLDEWMFVRAVERLVEDIPGERRRLLRLIQELRP